MTYNTLLIGIISLFIAQNSSIQNSKLNDEIEDKDLKELVQNNNQFALELFKELGTSNSNEFIATYSISSALAMTYLGSNGSTQDAMQKVLHFGDNNKQFHQTFSDLNHKLAEIDKNNRVDFSLVNQLWGNKNYNFKKEFLEKNKQFYSADLERLDFKKTEESAKIINDWVKEKTNNKIPKIVNPNALTDVELVLSNSIYFNAEWALEFDLMKSPEQNYFYTNKDSILKDFMIVEGWKAKVHPKNYQYRYAETEAAQLLELPYVGSRTSMLIILPKDQKGLPNLVQNLDEKQYRQWTQKLNIPKPKLNIKIPIWENDADYQLSDVLTKMGMGNAFSNQADFSLMSDQDEALHISKIIQKTFVSVSEKGTEASAATAIMMIPISGKGGPFPRGAEINFIADHPFLYLIKDNETNSILFIGQVTNPKPVNYKK